MDEWPIEYVTSFHPHCVRDDALKSLERLREMEITEAQIKVSALELQVQSLQHDQTVNQTHTSMFNHMWTSRYVERAHILSFYHLFSSWKLMKKTSEDSHDGEAHANVSTTESLRAQLEGISLLLKMLMMILYFPHWFSSKTSSSLCFQRAGGGRTSCSKRKCLQSRSFKH